MDVISWKNKQLYIIYLQRFESFDREISLRGTGDAIVLFELKTERKEIHMNKFTCQTTTKMSGMVLAACLGLVAAPGARAGLTGFDLGDSYNYVCIFQGGGGNTLNINNPASLDAHTDGGNIGIAGTGQLGLSGPLTINGNIDFSGSVNPTGYQTTTPPYTAGGNVTVNGTITGGHANVQTDMNNLNSLSATLGAEAGTSVALANGVNINAASGKIDGMGNSVFSVSSINAPNGNLTITGDGTHKVVVNISASADASFHFNTVTLLGGLTSNDVMFNFFGGSSSTLSGGPGLDLNSNGQTIAGIFLDPYGDISLVSTILDGRLYGGDSHNEQIVSGGTLVAQQIPSAPDAASTSLLLGMALSGVALVARRQKR